MGQILYPSQPATSDLPQKIAQRVREPAGLRDFFQRPHGRAPFGLVGRRYLHVVQRLSPSGFDLAPLTRGDRAGAGPSAPGGAPKGAARQRGAPLRFEDPWSEHLGFEDNQTVKELTMQTNTQPQTKTKSKAEVFSLKTPYLSQGRITTL